MPAPPRDPERRALRRAALDRLGQRHLLLICHDLSFPHSPGEDLGRGSPLSRAALDFAGFVADLGFTGFQLGPQGRTSAANPSPYDAALFSRDERAIAFGELVARGWLDADALAAMAARAVDAADFADHARANRLADAALDAAFGAFTAAGGTRDPDFAAFRHRHAGWLETDALHDLLVRIHGGRHQHDWPDPIDRELATPAPAQRDAAGRRVAALRASHAAAFDRYAFAQWLAAAQHAVRRRAFADLGLALFGDLQVGVGPVDAWRLGHCFLGGYALGAPPSRTNPAGQPWGYPVLDPDGLGAAGAARALHRERLADAAERYDGLRIDHPHGLVCPWVYRVGSADPHAAVRAGARLFESPDLDDHPGLARHARVAAAQIRRDRPRHADDRVGDLTPAQIDAYAVLLDDVGRHFAIDQIACEVLSTCPAPLAAVLARLRLGRFRVTAKADPDDPTDPYDPRHAAPRDWVMVGNHDTEPLWRTLDAWFATDRAGREARRLAAALGGGPLAASAAELAADPVLLLHAKFAEVLASPAAHAQVSFADLFGLRRIYNRPGIVDPDNWRLRVPHDWTGHPARAAAGAALDVDRALALALTMRGAAPGSDTAALVTRLAPRPRC